MSNNTIFKYKSKAFQDNDSMNLIYLIQKEEIEKLEKAIFEVFHNNFIKTSQIEGVRNYEKLVNLKGDASVDLDFRKRNVLDKFTYKPPFTNPRFKFILENIWGEGNFLFEILYDEFEVVIDVFSNDTLYYLQYMKNIRNLVPANMYLVLSIQYTYLYLMRNYTYLKLEELTYEELSQYSKEEE